MEPCLKKSFDTSDEAKSRLKEIKKSADKRKKTPDRVYKCKICSKFHLTAMSKKKFEATKNVEARNQHRQQKFIERETEFWEKRFKINPS